MSMKTRLRRQTPYALLVALLMLLGTTLGLGMPAAHAVVASQPNLGAINWHPHINQVSTQALQAAANSSTPETIPFWNSSFNYQGQNYPYNMVGKDPSKGSSITVIPTAMIPVKLTLANGTVYNGEDKAASTIASPLFQSAQFASGYTQYGDAMQRAEFWQDVSTPNDLYHVLLATPAVYPTLVLNVPADMGQSLTLRSGKIVAGVDINYLDTQFQNYMTMYQISPRVLPIFLSANTFGTEENGTLCCIGGYHSMMPNADNTAFQTYIYAEYGDYALSSSDPSLFTNTDALSHEISEWYNDPFLDDVVPAWSVPSEPQYGCTNLLEVGDPLVGVSFSVGSYNLQDEAFFSWFARQVPSIGLDGRYSYMGTFTAVSPPC